MISDIAEAVASMHMQTMCQIAQAVAHCQHAAVQFTQQADARRAEGMRRAAEEFADALLAKMFSAPKEG